MRSLAPYLHSTTKEHMPTSHQAHLEWTPRRSTGRNGGRSDARDRHGPKPNRIPRSGPRRSASCDGKTPKNAEAASKRALELGAVHQSPSDSETSADGRRAPRNRRPPRQRTSRFSVLRSTDQSAAVIARRSSIILNRTARRSARHETHGRPTPPRQMETADRASRIEERFAAGGRSGRKRRGAARPTRRRAEPRREPPSAATDHPHGPEATGRTRTRDGPPGGGAGEKARRQAKKDSRTPRQAHGGGGRGGGWEEGFGWRRWGSLGHALARNAEQRYRS